MLLPNKLPSAILGAEKLDGFVDDSLVRVSVVESPEGFWAKLAAVLFLARMRGPVIPQKGQAAKLAVANVARVRLLARVNPRVFGEPPLEPKSLGTRVAQKLFGSRARVRVHPAHVSHDDGFLLEFRRTKRTLELLAFRVKVFDVIRQSAFRQIDIDAEFAAENRFVRFFDHPAAFVFFEAVVVNEMTMDFVAVWERFPADAAYEKSLELDEFLQSPVLLLLLLLLPALSLLMSFC